MAAGVRVRRCSLTIRRRGGWSWGAGGAEAHLERALLSLEAAVDAAVAEAAVDPEADLVLDGRVALPIGADGQVSPESRRALVAALREAAAEQVRVVDTTHLDTVGGGQGDGLATEIVEALEAQEGVAGPALARTLGRWSRGGQLPRIAAAWPAPVLRAWLAAIAAGARMAGAPVTPLADAAVEAIAATVVPDGDGAEMVGRAAEERLLVVLSALTAALGDRLPDAAAQERARALVLATAPVEDAVRQAGARTANAERAVDGLDAPARATTGRPDRATPPAVVPALPFLVLAQLSRIGYADALAGAGGATSIPGATNRLAAALAAKVLPPPALRWRREPAELAALAFAAGRGDNAGDTSDAALAAATVAPLSSALQAAYSEGRSANDEVAVTATPHGVLVGEAAGLLSIAWVADDDEAGAVVAALGAPPARRDDAFAPLAEALHARVGLPRGGDAALPLERHLGAAAGTALGLLALDLFGDAATSLVALERLDDLEARAELTPGGLVIGIPRGRRWLDLQRAGLLDWFALPWLPNGRMEVGTW